MTFVFSETKRTLFESIANASAFAAILFTPSYFLFRPSSLNTAYKVDRANNCKAFDVWTKLKLGVCFGLSFDLNNGHIFNFIKLTSLRHQIMQNKLKFLG